MNTPIVRRIETILALVGGGNYLNRLHAEIAEKLRDLEDFVNSEKKDSTLTLDLKVKFTLSRDGMLRLTADHKFAEPKLPPQIAAPDGRGFLGQRRCRHPQPGSGPL